MALWWLYFPRPFGWWRKNENGIKPTTTTSWITTKGYSQHRRHEQSSQRRTKPSGTQPFTTLPILPISTMTIILQLAVRHHHHNAWYSLPTRVATPWWRTLLSICSTLGDPYGLSDSGTRYDESTASVQSSVISTRTCSYVRHLRGRY